MILRILLSSVLFFTTGVSVASQYAHCDAFADLAKSMAEARDKGVSLEESRSVLIDNTDFSDPEQISFLQDSLRLARMSYTTFSSFSPNELRIILRNTCIQQVRK